MKKKMISCTLVFFLAGLLLSGLSRISFGDEGKLSKLSPEGQFIVSAVKSKSPLIVDINQTVWKYSESRFQEFKSCKFISDILAKEGFKVTYNIPDMPTAFIARYGSGSPVIGITAEYDALPDLNQEAGVARESKDPNRVNGHGCGHSCLGAGSVGAALAVKEWLKDKPGKGTIVLLGTPGEESGYGKIHMLRRKCFDGIDTILTWHPRHLNLAWGRRAVGTICVQFKFFGIASHAGGAPEKGRSAVDAAELTNIGVNYLREHVSSQTRMHYAWLDSGLKAANIVHPHAALFYYVRSANVKELRETFNRVLNIAKGAALMTGTIMEHKVVGGTYDYMPNPTIIKTLSDAFVETGGPDFGEDEFKIAKRFIDALPKEKRREALEIGALHEGLTLDEFTPRPLTKKVEPYSPYDQVILTSSYDLGDISHLIPTGMIYVAVATPGTGLHTWQLAAMAGTSIGDKASEAAARAIALAAVRLYKNPDLIAQAKEELKKEEQGEYQSLFPENAKPVPNY